MHDAAGFHSVQSEKLSEQVTRQLVKALAEGRYRPGELLPSERDLAVRFSASRIVIREALTSLAARGIVTVRHGRGTIVNPIHEWNTLDPQLLLLVYGDDILPQLVEVRSVIEPELAALAAERITDPELAELSAMVDLPTYDTMEEHVDHDTRFHLCIARSAHNAVLMTMLSSISELLRESRRRSFLAPGHLVEAAHWHRRVFHAIEHHNASAARSAMAEHIEQVRRSLGLGGVENP
jgi:GntR family transcriptional regulator, transcriptional repressor for pyruvate dehydrogenase complex